MSSQLQARSFVVETYGCQMNAYDSDRMADVLRPLGYALAEGPDWRAVEVTCRAGPGDAAYEERHDWASVAGVMSGAFTYRSEAGRALLHAPLWSTSCLLPFLDGAAIRAWLHASGEPFIDDPSNANPASPRYNDGRRSDSLADSAEGGSVTLRPPASCRSANSAAANVAVRIGLLLWESEAGRGGRGCARRRCIGACSRQAVRPGGPGGMRPWAG